MGYKSKRYSAKRTNSFKKDVKKNLFIRTSIFFTILHEIECFNFKIKTDFMKSFIVFSFLCVTTFLHAQDFTFTQGIFSLMTNPAHLNIESQMSFQTHYRSQWTSLSNGFRSYGITGENYYQPMNSVFGGSLQYQKVANQFTSTKFHGYYGYRINLTETTKLQFAGAVGYLQNKTNYDQLIFEDQINPLNGQVIERSEQLSTDPTQHFFDAGVGMYVFDKQYEMGVYAKHFTQTAIYYPVTWGIQGKYHLFLHQQKGKQVVEYRISPLFAYQQQGISHQAVIGLEGKYENVILDFMYQSQQFSKPTIFSILLGIEQNNFQFAYNFDVNLLSQKGGDSHEIRIGYLIESKKNIRVK